jgi:hypothetical protein
MPVEFESDQSIDLTIATITGTPTFDEIITAIEAFYGGQPTKKVIWNWGGCDPSQLTFTDIENLALLPSRYSDLRKGGKTALVAPGDLSFGISRAFQSLGDVKDLPFTVGVFRNLSDAVQWIAKP